MRASPMDDFELLQMGFGIEDRIGNARFRHAHRHATESMLADVQESERAACSHPVCDYHKTAANFDPLRLSLSLRPIYS